MRLFLFESHTKGNLNQSEFRRMMDMIAADIAGIEAAQREFVAEAGHKSGHNVRCWIWSELSGSGSVVDADAFLTPDFIFFVSD
jgi:hypothetical protein